MLALVELVNHSNLNLRRRFLQLVAGAASTAVMSVAATVARTRQPSLKKQINTYIQKLRRTSRILPHERSAWSVFDFTSGSKLFSINENQQLQAASMIKAFLAQACFFRHRDESRRYPYDKPIRLKLKKMIRNNDNSAANSFINRAPGVMATIDMICRFVMFIAALSCIVRPSCLRKEMMAAAIFRDP